MHLFSLKNSLWLVLLLCGLWACNNNTEKVTLSKVEARSSKKKNKKKPEVLVYSEQMNADESYANIRGNVPRLKAMISGYFVQYSTIADPTVDGFTPWLVNGNKDSIVLYSLPVGEPNRDGHWLYMHQFMTSLPEEPLYTAFVKMEEINRDSIIATYYSTPEDFSFTLEQVMDDPKGVFREFKFDQLKPAGDEVVCYERKTPLQYEGYSQWMDNTDAGLKPEEEDGYNRDYYVITPGHYYVRKSVYDKNKNYQRQTPNEWLKRLKMLSDAHRGQ